MKHPYDDRLVKSRFESSEEQEPTVASFARLTDGEAPGGLTRGSFLMRLAGFFGTIGLTGCAVFLSGGSKYLRRQATQYCTCVPVCVCDLVCTCNMVFGKVNNTSKKENKMVTGKHPELTCACVPVCTCDLVCTCNSQCSCHSHYGSGSRTYCKCNLICTCQAVYR